MGCIPGGVKCLDPIRTLMHELRHVSGIEYLVKSCDGLLDDVNITLRIGLLPSAKLILIRISVPEAKDCCYAKHHNRKI
jgi:hypothetical protein